MFSYRVLILLEFIFLYTEQCGGDIIGSTGEFTSPNYPEKYGDNLNCVWIIEVPQDHIIELTFQHFDIENGFDSLEVFDGDTPTAKSLNKYSGSIKPESIVSSGNKLKINLQSDQLHGGTGFLAQYKASKFNFFYFDQGKRNLSTFPAQKIPMHRTVRFLSTTGSLDFCNILVATL